MGRCKHAGIDDSGLHPEFLKSQREVACGAVVSFTECSGDDKYAFFFRHLEFARGDFKTECGIASMDFSAFLVSPMRKKDDKPNLRTVDESPEGEVLRPEGQPVAENEGNVRLEIKERSELKFKTHESKLDAWEGPNDVTLEDDWNTEKQPVRLHKGFWIAIGLVLLAAIGWLSVEIYGLKRQEEQQILEAQRLLEREKQAEIDARQTIDVIGEVVRKFYASSSTDEMLKYVRHPDRVGPSLREYYSKNPMKGSEVVWAVDMNPMTLGTRGGFWVVQAKLSSGIDGRLVVEINSPTDVKVDWETSVCAQPMEWERFVKDRPAGYRGDFRVFVQIDNFYNYEFADERKYQAFKLTTLNSSEVMYGYALRDGQTFRVLEELIKNNRNEKVPVMLRLYLQEGFQSKDGVLIEQIVSPRWLLVDYPEGKK